MSRGGWKGVDGAGEEWRRDTMHTVGGGALGGWKEEGWSSRNRVAFTIHACNEVNASGEAVGRHM